MAPEILGYRQYGVQADLWSIGVIFLEIIVGNLPWKKAQGSEIAVRKKQFFYRFSEG